VLAAPAAVEGASVVPSSALACGAATVLPCAGVAAPGSSARSKSGAAG